MCSDFLWSCPFLQYKDFTLDPVNFPAQAMNQFVQALHNNGQHYGELVGAGHYCVFMYCMYTAVYCTTGCVCVYVYGMYMYVRTYYARVCVRHLVLPSCN